MSSTYEEMQQDLQQKRLETRANAEFLRFLRRPEAAGIDPSDANLLWFLREGFGGDWHAFSESGCLLLMDNPSFTQGLSYVTPKAVRAEMIEQIIGLLRKAMTPDQLVVERKKLANLPLTAQPGVPSLTKRLEELTRMKTLERNFTPQEIRKIGKPGAPANHILVPGIGYFPILPADVTADRVKRMAPAELRKVIRMYHASQITARLNGEN